MPSKTHIHRVDVRSLTAIVGCDVHTVNNRRILEALRQRFGAGKASFNNWCATWIGNGFDAFEAPATSTRRQRLRLH